VAEEYLKKAGYKDVTLVKISKKTCGAQLDQVMNSNYDLIFNICCGGYTSSISGYDVT
jgi:predicted O-methyltransferase YrrM